MCQNVIFWCRFNCDTIVSKQILFNWKAITPQCCIFMEIFPMEYQYWMSIVYSWKIRWIKGWYSRDIIFIFETFSMIRQYWIYANIEILAMKQKSISCQYMYNIAKNLNTWIFHFGFAHISKQMSKHIGQFLLFLPVYFTNNLYVIFLLHIL